MADDLLKVRLPLPRPSSHQAFDTLLEKTVVSTRLSGSKVKELQELALKAVAHDHHLVTSLLKLNTSLPPASSSRISSLYVFDAIARAAKSASKGTHVSTERGRGTPAGLLAKMEGVADEWIQGMVDDGKGGVWSDGRVSLDTPQLYLKERALTRRTRRARSWKSGGRARPSPTRVSVN
jgi:protein NRD1